MPPCKVTALFETMQYGVLRILTKKLLRKIYFLINERTYQGRVKYVLKKRNNKALVISFSGFSPTPVYNYMRTLNSVKADQLYILDDFGYKGSYYWYENGKEEPRLFVQGLINQVVIRGGTNV